MFVVHSSDPVHTHGRSRPRPNRRLNRQSSELAELKAMQRCVAECHRELEKERQHREHENEVQNMQTKQQQDRIAHLEIIVADLVNRIPFGSLDPSMEKLIRRNAPDALPDAELIQWWLDYQVPNMCGPGDLRQEPTTDPQSVYLASSSSSGDPNRDESAGRDRPDPLEPFVDFEGSQNL